MGVSDRISIRSTVGRRSPFCHDVVTEHVVELRDLGMVIALAPRCAMCAIPKHRLRQRAQKGLACMTTSVIPNDPGAPVLVQQADLGSNVSESLGAHAGRQQI